MHYTSCFEFHSSQEEHFFCTIFSNNFTGHLFCCIRQLGAGCCDKSSVVYKIDCCDCDGSYIGKTGRALKTCMLKHCRAVQKMDFSASALAQHALEYGHHIDWISTCVLGS